MKTLLFLGFMCLFMSCHKYPDTVEQALKQAGDNRKELEKVLEHFRRQGKIPYQSACFLIENMPYHQSKKMILLDSAYNSYFERVDSIYSQLFANMTIEEIRPYKKKKHDSLCISLAEKFNGFVVPKISNVDKTDIQIIDSEFLVDNIESALRIWNEKGYKTDEDFDFFKEFILPYRTTNEFPLIKRSQIRKMYKKILLDSLLDTTHESVERYKIYVDKCRWLNKYVKPKKHMGIYDLFVPRFKMDCHNMTNWSCNVLRACGIPVVYEYTPKWLDRDSKHYWCNSPDSTGIVQPYTAPGNNLREDWDSNIKYCGKVYRKTFGVQYNTPYFMATENEFIPKQFSTPLLSDQTFRYHQTITFRLPLLDNIDNNIAYICMVTTKGLTPVGWGKIDHRKSEIIFEQIPLNTLFFPVIFDGETMLDINEPFMILSSRLRKDIPEPLTVNEQQKKKLDISLVNGKLLVTGANKQLSGMKYITLKCDTTKKETLHLLRKYPEKRRLKALQERIKGSYILGSNKEKRDFDTLYILDYVPYPYFQEVEFKNDKKYRYYRFRNPDKKGVNIAHMEFLGKYSRNHKCSSPTPLPIFSKEQLEDKNQSLYRINGIPLNTGHNAADAFDGNYDTYVTTSSVGMDFGTPVQINRIRFVPRTANNGIVPGNSYALFYYANGWKEFKILYAENSYLDFKDVPYATLYWLRNLTTGKEELPFFYSNGKQYFLHTDTINESIY